MIRIASRFTLLACLLSAGCSSAATVSATEPAPSPAPAEEDAGPLAFPGALGFGASATGGRGGKVIYVTNLNPDGKGSFKEAAQTAGPRVILFEVAGNIPIRGIVNVPDGNVTIACQSAPGGGVSFVGGTVVFGQLDDATSYESQQHIKARNIVVRHCRSRDPAASTRTGDNADGLLFLNVDLVMLDHVSIAWATDESGATRRSRRITWQNCLVTEPLINGKHSKGAHPYGPMASYGTHDWSMLGCFLSNGWHRFPHMMGNNRDLGEVGRASGARGGERERMRQQRSGRSRGQAGRPTGQAGRPTGGRYSDSRIHLGPAHPVFLFAGNTVYNVGGPDNIGGSEVAIGAQAVVEDNAYWRGPDTPPGWLPILGHDRPDSPNTGSKIFLRGNTLDGVLPERQRDLLGSRHSIVPLPSESATRWTAPSGGLPSATDLASVGALPHDEIDARVLREFATRTGKQGAPWRKAGDAVPAPASGKPAPDRDRDGMPDTWESRRGRDPGRYDPWEDRDCNGWGDLEDYLNERAGDPPVAGDCTGRTEVVTIEVPAAPPLPTAPPPAAAPKIAPPSAAADALGCADIARFDARCGSRRGASGIQARVLLHRSHEGKRVTISVDGRPQSVAVTGARAVLELRDGSPGSHTVSLMEPPSCAPDVVVVCPDR